ncbi:MAG: hypothetical protein RR314_00065 [Oscillospiraceae bacterium]
MDEEAKLSWGRDLPGDLSQKWPRDASGEFIPAALLATSSQIDMGDAVLISMLESFGIPSFRKFPHCGGFGNLMLGMSAEGVDVFVPETLLEDAKALMEGVHGEDEDL